MADGAASHVAVLAGGRGSRLGGGKPLIELAGRPLIAWPLAAVAAAGLTPVVVAKSDTPLPPDLAARGIELLVEPDRPVHPLAGIVTALRELEAPVVACACDMPFVPPDLLAWLATRGDADVVVPVHEGRMQPVLARYHPRALPALEQAVAAQASAAGAIERARAELVDAAELARFGDPARVFFDVDSPEDLDAAAALIA